MRICAISIEISRRYICGSLTGSPYFAGNKREVLPALEKKLSPDGFKDREKYGVNLCERAQHELLDTPVI